MIFEPSHSGNLEAAKVCPSVNLDLNDLISKKFQTESSEELGVVKSVWLAQSCNKKLNINSSSGGLIKELLFDLLRESPDFSIIALGHIKGLLYEPLVINQSNEIDDLPGSIYHNVSFEKALKYLKSEDKMFILIALPCQLEGIYNYIYNFDPELEKKILHTIGLACGWTFSHHAINAICKFKKINTQNIKEIFYRGGGPVGKLKNTNYHTINQCKSQNRF